MSVVVQELRKLPFQSSNQKGGHFEVVAVPATPCIPFCASTVELLPHFLYFVGAAHV